MAASTIPAAKAALFALLDTNTTLAKVPRTWSDAPPDQLGREHIYYGPTANITRTPKTFGDGVHFDEDYTLELILYARAGGYDQQAVEDGLWALVALIETLLAPTRANAAAVTLNGTVRSALIGGFDDKGGGTPVQDDAGWAHEIGIQIDVQARV